MTDDEILMYGDVPPVLPKAGERVPLVFKANDDTWRSREVVITSIDDNEIHIESVDDDDISGAAR